MLLAAALGLAAIATDTPPQPAFRKAELEAMSTKELAKAMLLPDMAEVVTSHQFATGLFPESNYSGVGFLTPPRSVAYNFCARTRYYVSLHPVERTSEQTLRTDAPAMATSFRSSEQIALSTDCADVRTFAHINSGDIPMAMELLGFLAELRKQASSPTGLSVKVSCATDLEDDYCQPGALAHLASLKIEDAFIIERPSRLEGSRWKWRISIPEIPGVVGPYAEINLDGPPPCVTEVEIRRKVPAPF